ncbi:MAG: ribonuclease III [Bryobacteraceae bacterium]|nr:ribonuclease III [Bryobacteraceae bacterium]
MKTQRPAEPDLCPLEHRLGHAFADRSLLRQALSHRSYAAEKVGGAAPLSDQNEQLEHLGDSVLGFLVSEYLFRRFTAVPEGRLTQMKAELVNATHLYRTALRLELGQFLLLGKTEEVNGGRAKKALLANAVEALIAALYLDGGLERVRHFVLNEIVGDFSPFEPLPDISAADFKGALQEIARLHKLPPPHYAVVREDGPQHAKTFTVEVRVGDFQSCAESSTKKEASQMAAKEVLRQITAPDSP